MNASREPFPGSEFDPARQRRSGLLSPPRSWPWKDREPGALVDRHDAPRQEVVAAVLTYRERLCLLRRSAQVGSDIGQWHCVTGFLPAHEDPLQQAIQEILEETGIGGEHLSLQHSVVLELEGADGKHWRVHAFHFNSLTDHVEINWENDLSQWVPHHQLAEMPTVTWLADVLGALHESLLAAVTAGRRVMARPDEVAPACSKRVAQIVRKAFDPGEVVVAEGGKHDFREIFREPEVYWASAGV